MEAYIETPRLVLRGFCLQDGQSMFDSYCSDEEAARYMPWHAHKSVQQTERDLRERLLPRQADENWLPLAIAKKQRPQQVIGNIGAFLHGGVAELGYVLGLVEQRLYERGAGRRGGISVHLHAGAQHCGLVRVGKPCLRRGAEKAGLCIRERNFR